ncbi:MAG: response regulator transcription factor [Chlorobi bacterium]|nr:response regulator transcription factor [Chlorobiota bacterium]
MSRNNDTITAIIIDDEQPAREVIRRFLKDYPGITILADCEDGFEGVRCILRNKPDLVFLDVQMPRVNGFEMLELLEEKPVIIFSTAYHEYAIRAFEVSAADFLLKPYSKERFAQAIEKALELIRSGKKQSSLDKLSGILRDSPEEIHRIVVKKRSGIFIIPVEEIYYLSAQDDYVEIITQEGSFLKKQTMNYYEKHLPAGQFFRIHRSHMINITQIHRIEPYAKNSFKLILHDGTSLPVSRSGMKELKKSLHL